MHPSIVCVVALSETTDGRGKGWVATTKKTGNKCTLFFTCRWVSLMPSPVLLRCLKLFATGGTTFPANFSSSPQSKKEVRPPFHVIGQSLAALLVPQPSLVLCLVYGRVPLLQSMAAAPVLGSSGDDDDIDLEGKTVTEETPFATSPLKIKVVDGRYLIRVYLLNNTFVSLLVPRAGTIRVSCSNCCVSPGGVFGCCRRFLGSSV